MRSAASAATWKCPKRSCSVSRFPALDWLCASSGEVTPERVALLQEADDIVVEEIKAAGLYQQIWQSFAVLLPVKSVGVMGDQRTYAYTCAIRAVHSEDGMTADWVPLPYDRAQENLQPHRQRDPRHQPRRLRHHIQATRHHRVGIAGRYRHARAFGAMACMLFRKLSYRAE